MAGNILTEEEYALAIDRRHALQKAVLLQRFRMGEKKYGVLYLNSRDWKAEGLSEKYDQIAYDIINDEADDRLIFYEDARVREIEVGDPREQVWLRGGDQATFDRK